MELTDIKAPLQAMDDKDIALQVLYPTLFLAYPPSSNPSLLTALCSSYNHWLGHQLSGNESVKWAAVINLDDVPAGVSEVREAKKLGGVAVMVLGTAGDNLLDHSTLFLFYEAVADEGLALHRSRLHPGLGDNVVDYERNEIQYWQEDPSIRKLFEEKLAEREIT
jgi:hypothetical protein